MIDARAYPIQTTRDHIVRSLVSETVTPALLVPDQEDDARSLTMLAVADVLTAADAYVASLAELAAVSSRLDTHVRAHRACLSNLACSTHTALRRDVSRLNRACERSRTYLAQGGR